MILAACPSLSTVSARALNVEGTSLAIFFHQPGMRPHRIGKSSGPFRNIRMSTIGVVHRG